MASNLQRPDPNRAAVAQGRAPMLMGGRMVMIVIGTSLVLGLGLIAGARWLSAPRVYDDALARERQQKGVEAYQNQRWEEAAAWFSKVTARDPVPARANDYLDRLELIRRDAELLEQAEDALHKQQLERAAALADAVPPNSPLFSQAEIVARTARGETAAAAPPFGPR